MKKALTGTMIGDIFRPPGETMATANHIDDNITISSEADDLLDCFVDEMDAPVLRLAGEVAKRRLGGSPPGDVPLEITGEDVKIAAGFIFSHFKEQFAEGKLPDHLKEAVDAFERCFKAKCENK